MTLKNSTNKIRDLSLEIDKLRIPNHIAVIMDGNGRWGVKKGLSRSHGHNKGVSVLKDIIKFSKQLGVKVLTVYAFSTENWSRPAGEVDFLLDLFGKVLENEIDNLHRELIRIKFILIISLFNSSISLSKTFSNKFNKKFTSSTGLDQFSVEKA